jgi:hypothetical protein
MKEPKYKIGEIVYYLNHGLLVNKDNTIYDLIEELRIIGIFLKDGKYKYSIHNTKVLSVCPLRDPLFRFWNYFVEDSLYASIDSCANSPISKSEFSHWMEWHVKMEENKKNNDIDTLNKYKEELNKLSHER